MTVQSKWAARLVTASIIALAGVIPASTAASASPSTLAPASVQQLATSNYPVPTPVTVNYGCYVTFPGGSTTMPYSLTFGVYSPAAVAPYQVFGVAFDPPAITPNPQFQSDVRDVTVQYKLPANARLLGYALFGGSGLGSTVPTVERIGNVLVLKAAGPFQAGVPFDLPTLGVGLRAKNGDVIKTGTGGSSVDNPSFSWTRNSVTPGDPPNTLRPFQCEPPTPVTFSSTTVA